MTTPTPKISYAHSGFFAMRTPLLPFDEFLSWSQKVTASASTEDLSQLEQALLTDRRSLREQIQSVYARPEIRDALFVASPNMDQAYERWLQSPDSEKGQGIERALVRYFSRMTCRPTPFGLFAGCSVGTIGEETHLYLDSQATYHRHTRLDMDYLYTLVGELERDPALADRLRYYPNSSLYSLAGRIRYAETRLENRVRSYFLVAVETSDYLEAVLTKAREGATIDVLAQTIVDLDSEILVEEAQEYIRQLIQNQLLVSQLSPTITGPELMYSLMDQVRQHPVTHYIAECLERVQVQLNQIDADGLGVDSKQYQAIASELKVLPAKVDLPRLFQVDMVKPSTTLRLGQNVLDEVASAIDLLHRMAEPPAQDPLAQFRTAFTARYEEGQEIPLLEILDEELGISFQTAHNPKAEAAPLLKNLILSPMADSETVQWRNRHGFLLRMVEQSLAQGKQEIVLKPSDLEHFKSRTPAHLPDALAVMVTLMGASSEAVEQGDFQLVLNGAYGPSGARMLGRFCHADPVLHQFVEDHLRAEEALRPDAVLAEVVHLPEGRLGNILSRPVLRQYEIPYLGQSGVPTDDQIPVTDLVVTVRGGRVILRSKKLGREVIPRLTSAHNFSQGLGVYRFLCLLQTQSTTPYLGWNWGILEQSSFLPRVSIGRLVLSKARWLVTQAELKELTPHKGSQLFLAVQRWRAKRQVPRLILLEDGDNQLPIDLENILSIETFIHLVKKRSSARIIEMLAGPENQSVRGPEGAFTNELIIPFVRRPEAALPKRPAPKTLPMDIQYRFPPGSEWLYLKLYTGTATADRILNEVLRDVVCQLTQSGVIDRWFFIRYGDPDWHLRLRFHGRPDQLLTEAFPRLQQALNPLVEDGRIWRIQLDTYVREVDRYGGPTGMVLAEQIFGVESQAVLKLLELLSGDEGADVRWKLTVCGIDQLLTDFGLDIHQKEWVMKQSRQAFGEEFQADTTGLKHQLGANYQQEKRNLESLLTSRSLEGPLGDGIAILRDWSGGLKPLMAELKQAEQAGRLSIPIVGLVRSYVHMFVNRLLRSAQRPQELVLYEFLARFYESQLARTRTKHAKGL
ncbi:MAG: lantibiotic dehydratase [Acidobacteria bacterium]|nr:lantibiotic dehydratase [Acidobacteriota bacterium]